MIRAAIIFNQLAKGLLKSQGLCKKFIVAGFKGLGRQNSCHWSRIYSFSENGQTASESISTQPGLPPKNKPTRSTFPFCSGGLAKGIQYV